jgi:hypothetical protein
VLNTASACLRTLVPRSVRPFLTFAAASWIALIAGCSVGNPATTSPAALSGTTHVRVLAASTANDQFSALTLNITGITLSDAQGKTVTLLSTPQYVEFMHLNGGVEPLTTVNIPQDVYTSATVSVTGGMPLCINSVPTANVTYYSIRSAQASQVTVNLPTPITVTGTAMGLKLNLQVSKSTNYSTCAGIVTGPAPFSLTPTFDLTPVTLAAQPTNSTNGKASGLRGLISTVSAGGANFSVAGDLGATTNAPIWQVSTNGSTVFQGVTSVSQLTVGLPVNMDVALQADGSLLATRVAVYDAAPTSLSFASGPLSFVATAEPAIASLLVEGQGPVFLGLEAVPIQNNLGNAVFQTGAMQNLSALPFTASFNAANIVPGQNIFVTTHAATFAGQLPATTITLLPQTINGTVRAISNSGNFTIYTVALPAYNLFPNLATQQGQSTLLTNPSSLTVYVDSNTQLLNSNPITVGSVLRFSGLVFNDNGTLRMDCAQLDDGVAE